MKVLFRILARLYPAAWRERYGSEFEALIEDARPGLRGILDILKGALTMQLSSWTPFRVLAASVVAGVLIAIGFALRLPEQWSSAAVIQVVDAKMPDRVLTASNTVFSRSALTKIIREEGLYGDQLKASPVEDVIEVFKRAVEVTSVPGANGTAFQVRFVYEDPRLAQQVAQKLATSFVEIEPQAFRVIEVAMQPQQPLNATFSAKIASVGFGGGLLIGAPIALVLYWRRRKRS